MNQDSNIYNVNSLPPDRTSFFKQFIQSQDEVPESFKKMTFVGNPKDVYPRFYIKQVGISADPNYCVSIFHTDKKQIIDFEEKERIVRQSDMSYYILMFCLIIGALIFFIKNKQLSQVFKAFYLPHFTNQLVRDGMVQREMFFLPLLLIYYVSLSMLIMFSLNRFLAFETSINMFLYILGIILFLSVLRIFIINFIKWTFKTRKETLEYNTHNIIFSIVMGLFLVPAVFMIYYIQEPLSGFFLYFCRTLFEPEIRSYKGQNISK